MLCSPTQLMYCAKRIGVFGVPSRQPEQFTVSKWTIVAIFTRLRNELMRTQKFVPTSCAMNVVIGRLPTLYIVAMPRHEQTKI